MASFKFIFVSAALALLAGCASNPGVVNISPDTYYLSKEDGAGIFGNLSTLKAKTINEANEFARKQGKIAIPISMHEVPLGPGRLAKFDYQFRVVDASDPEAKRTSLQDRADYVIEKKEKIDIDFKSKNEGAKSVSVYDELIKLEDLRQRGILTPAEFNDQKQQILKTSKQ